MKNVLQAILVSGGRDIPPSEDYDCHSAPPDHKPTTARLWTPNRVSTAVAGAHVRTEITGGELPPTLPAGRTFFGVPAPGDDALSPPVGGGPTMYAPGFAEAVTIHPGRHRANLGEANEEVCHYATGVLTLDDSGFGVAVMGNFPDDAEDATNYIGFPFVASAAHLEAEPRIGMEEGFCYFAGGVQNPPAVEYHYHSPRHWCAGID